MRAVRKNPVVFLEAALVGSYEALANLVYRGGKFSMAFYTSGMAATVAA